jgi:hypothetical protein
MISNERGYGLLPLRAGPFSLNTLGAISNHRAISLKAVLIGLLPLRSSFSGLTAYFFEHS